MTLERTYLQRILKDHRTFRWPDKAMPIRVYVAPFQWYEQSKQMRSETYHQLVLEALQTWSAVSGNQVRFQLVNQLLDSQIDFKWRRVDRKSLGHCEYVTNENFLIFSAEISIGISDGLLHAQYNSIDEVRHTILHEIGHALGLIDHSDHPADIMYVPHQYGVTQLSARDADTLQALYSVPPGFDYRVMGQNMGLTPPFGIQTVLDVINCVIPRPSTQVPANPAVLEAHHDILTQMGMFHLNTQNVGLNPDIKRLLIQSKPNLVDKS
jgi:predicted Zn-dependent protease